MPQNLGHFLSPCYNKIMKNSTWKIIAKNTFTLFNLVNLILALMVASVGSYKNMLFIGVAIANTLISIINELRAQKIVDKLKLLSEKNPVILKNGTPTEVKLEEVQKSDTLVLALGDQIQFDSELKTGYLEVNEAFVTGEQDSIKKYPGDELISGSFVVAGSGEAKVTHAGAENSINKIQAEASSIKTADSKLFKLMNNIVKYISWALIPIGALLLWSRLSTEANTADAVTSTVAALINMIPEGLILLTSSILALATVRLGKKKVLVQDLYAIETLARVDTICLDKTGTLTSGKMVVHDYTQLEKSFLKALKAILTHQTVENGTISALNQKFVRMPEFKATDDFTKIDEVCHFSSERKYSGVRVGKTNYLMGAVEFLTDDPEIIAKVRSLSDGYRTLAIVKQSEDAISKHCADSDSQNYNGYEFESGTANFGENSPNRCNFDDRESSTLRNGTSDCSERLLGVIRLEDEIRPTAKKIIQYFYDNDIAVKIISGDDLAAVQDIAKKVGVRDLSGVNLPDCKNPNYDQLVKKYSIFTRVKPNQKKLLIQALKKQGHTVAMTGDGVNDILAMKEADCSLAIGEGSDAARRAAKFVLLDSGFEGIPSIIDEGRQSVNNLERSTTLFLAKTVYAAILAVIFVFLPFSYPFSPIEMSLLNFVCIGFPGLILALEKNTDRIKNQFVTNIIEYSVPIGLTVSIAMLALSIISHHNDFSRFELTTTSVFITFTIDLVLIYWISRPLNKLRSALLISIIAIMAGVFLIPFARDFFEFTILSQNGLIIMLAVIAMSLALFFLLRSLAKKLSAKLAL